jgi:hypothetical protein
MIARSTFILLRLTAIVIVASCAPAEFNWKKSAQSLVRGACVGSSRCELRCELPEIRRSECENRAPASPGARRQ